MVIKFVESLGWLVIDYRGFRAADGTLGLRGVCRGKFRTFFQALRGYSSIDAEY